MQDLFIGKFMKGRVNPGVAMSTTAAPLIPSDDRRMTLVISLPITNRLTISTSPNVTDLNGIVLGAGVVPLVMSFHDWGELIRRPLFGILNANTETIGWAESVLDLSLEELIELWQDRKGP